MRALEAHSIDLRLDDPFLRDGQDSPRSCLEQVIHLKKILLDFPETEPVDTLRVETLWQKACEPGKLDYHWHEEVWDRQVNEQVFQGMSSEPDGLRCYAKPSITQKAFESLDAKNEWTRRYPDRLFGFKENPTQPVGRVNSCFDREFLDRLGGGEKPVWISPLSKQCLYFPWAVHEAKQDEDEHWAKAYDQAATCATLCTLGVCQLAQGDERPPPTIAFISVGAKWALFLCYRYEDRTRFSQLWNGDITGRDDACKLLYIVDTAKRWALDTFKPWVIEKLKPHAERLEAEPYSLSPKARPRKSPTPTRRYQGSPRNKHKDEESCKEESSSSSTWQPRISGLSNFFPPQWTGKKPVSTDNSEFGQAVNPSPEIVISSMESLSLCDGQQRVKITTKSTVELKVSGSQKNSPTRTAKKGESSKRRQTLGN